MPGSQSEITPIINIPSGLICAICFSFPSNLQTLVAIMHLAASRVITVISGLLASCTAKPLSSDVTPSQLDKRACPADCNNQYPLARALGQTCGGDCGRTYRVGAITCSCNLGAVVSGS